MKKLDLRRSQTLVKNWSENDKANGGIPIKTNGVLDHVVFQQATGPFRRSNSNDFVVANNGNAILFLCGV